MRVEVLQAKPRGLVGHIAALEKAPEEHGLSALQGVEEGAIVALLELPGGSPVVAEEEPELRGTRDVRHPGLQLGQILVKARIVGSLEGKDVKWNSAGLEGQELVEDEGFRKHWKLFQHVANAALVTSSRFIACHLSPPFHPPG